MLPRLLPPSLGLWATLVLVGCPAPAPSPGHASTAATRVPASVGAASSTGGASSPAPGSRTSAGSGEPLTLRVYVAGESIERRNRFVMAPLLASGALAERGGGPGRNDNDEYGWMVPLARRLAIRDGGITVKWVGADTWLSAEDEPYSGSYPAQPGHTSAISGTDIPSWLEQRRGELEARSHCYDVAFAARGGNDFGNDDDTAYQNSLMELIGLLLAGSSCRPSPIVYVTAHMPDDQRGGGGPSDAEYVAQQRHRFVERVSQAVKQAQAARPSARIRFVDLFTPFTVNQATTAFPKETWSSGGIPDYAKIGREGDLLHVRRLASIYAGELAADAMDLAELRSLR